MKKVISLTLFIFTFFIFSSVNVSAQQKRRNLIVKTNILNIPMYPSVHIEQQVARSSSFQANIHYGFFAPYSENDWLNASLDFRQYFKDVRITKIKGFYLSPGVNFRNEFLYWRKNEKGEFLGQGISHLGLQLKAGYQWMLINDRLILDFGGGAAADLMQLQENVEDKRQIFPRVNASIGFNISAAHLHGRDQ